MSDPDLNGPDLLESMAQRYASQGFHLEAQSMRTLERQWREERGEFAPFDPPIVNGVPMLRKPLVSRPLAPANSIQCEIVPGAHPGDLPKLEIHGNPNLPIGPCWLVPLEPAA